MTTGDVTTWCATFADNSSFGEVVRVAEHARSTGPRFATSALLAHPILPYVVSVGCASQVRNGGVGVARDKVQVIAWSIHAEPPQDSSSDGDDVDTGSGNDKGAPVPRGASGTDGTDRGEDVDDYFGVDAQMGSGGGAAGSSWSSSRTYMHGGALRHVTSTDVSWPSRGRGGDVTPFGTPTHPPSVAHWLDTTPTQLKLAVYAHGRIIVLSLAPAETQNIRAPSRASTDRTIRVEATIDVAGKGGVGLRMCADEEEPHVVGCAALFSAHVGASDAPGVGYFHAYVKSICAW